MAAKPQVNGNSLKLQKRKLGELLLQSGVLTEEQLLKALDKQKKSGKRLGEVLVESKFTSEIEIAQTVGSQLGYQFVETISAVDKEVLLLVPETLVKKHSIIPLRLEKGELVIAMADPLDFNTIQDLSFYCGFIIQPAVATPTLLQESIKKFYGNIHGQTDEKLIKKIINESQKDFSASALQIIPEIRDDGSEGMAEQRHQLAPIIEMANLILAKALKLNTSDIHIEPFANDSIVRYRVDGLLHESMRFPKWIHGALVSRIKVLANLDISVKRIPQDGDIRLKANGREITLRISSLPSYYGEKVVIRILDETTDLLRLESLGLSKDEQAKIREMLSHRKGLILVTGPTGSGKTTSLYAMLNQINQNTVNIITVENPIEYHLPGVTQVQINPESGLTFATALRSILRQDPNVILIGEIRDSETAQIAMRAALTGHLVISTLHTNDAPSAVNRLFDLGIPNFMVSSLLIGVIAQRLVRNICPECKSPVQPTEEEKIIFNLNENKSKAFQFYKGKGCKLCHQSGLKGRSAVYEILQMNSKLREVLSLNPTEQQFKSACRDAGFVSMNENALQKVREGVTTCSEVMRCIGIDENLETFCGKCNHHYRAEYLLCPVCGEKPNNKCRHCNQMIQPNWNYCPYCEKRLAKSLA
ncbi:MAG: Flp pilus assembly complex ATPase component TadA [Nitrospirae bacterium]|nr:Flp pilus assembly complex ATPase component TadA [Nitrospirota bacterium]